MLTNAQPRKGDYLSVYIVISQTGAVPHVLMAKLECSDRKRNGKSLGLIGRKGGLHAEWVGKY